LGAIRELPADKCEVGTRAIARCPHVAAVEVAVAAHEHPATALADARQDLVEHAGRAVGRPDTAGPVADGQAFASPGERDARRLLAPGALVEVRALLLDTVQWLDVAIDVDDRPRLVAPTTTAPQAPPDRGLHLVDGVAQPGKLMILFVEAPQEVAARRWIGDP